jgi:hypothetical protein
MADGVVRLTPTWPYTTPHPPQNELATQMWIFVIVPIGLREGTAEVIVPPSSSTPILLILKNFVDCPDIDPNCPTSVWNALTTPCIE